MRKPVKRGITLFESVAALTIVGLVAVSALEAVGAEMRTAERARRALEAEALATQRLDAMDLMTDQELQAVPDSVASGAFDAPLDEYKWATTSTPISEQPGVYAVAVKVTWSTGSYTQHTQMYRRPRQFTAPPRGGP
jgi:type II secretory pathway pseudopilin PulG